MRFFDWLLRRKPKGRRKGAAFRGSETDKINATKASDQFGCGRRRPCCRPLSQAFRQLLPRF
jgi:hypothetical protein